MSNSLKINVFSGAVALITSLGGLFIQTSAFALCDTQGTVPASSRPGACRAATSTEIAPLSGSSNYASDAMVYSGTGPATCVNDYTLWLSMTDFWSLWAGSLNGFGNPPTPYNTYFMNRVPAALGPTPANNSNFKFCSTNASGSSSYTVSISLTIYTNTCGGGRCNFQVKMVTDRGVVILGQTTFGTLNNNSTGTYTFSGSYNPNTDGNLLPVMIVGNGSDAGQLLPGPNSYVRVK